jgi:hypothetical protein
MVRREIGADITPFVRDRVMTYGCLQCAQRLTAEKRLASESETAYPKQVETILELAEDKLRAVYSV